MLSILILSPVACLMSSSEPKRSKTQFAAEVRALSNEWKT